MIKKEEGEEVEEEEEEGGEVEKEEKDCLIKIQYKIPVNY
jgi:hypothetical protein